MLGKTPYLTASLCLLSYSALAVGVEFNTQIRPLLSDRCFQCHGPDEETLEADLRLDSFEGATADLGGYAAIVPGSPDQSELLFRVSSHAGDDIMPPENANKALLTKGEIALLRQWIEEGAHYQSHWSFLPISHPTPPTSGQSRAKNPIDRFIAQSLEPSNLDPAPEADPHTLAKRLAIDLTGLLPSPRQSRAFVEAYQKDPDRAVEVLVGQLLASPHHGERWGRHWLDQARYADSNGYTIDGDRTMWPFRDWVIQAINDDLPFDQFTIEQLAGDLLDSPDKAQLIATGFHRNTLINQEGGTDNEQFRNEEVVDRVNTTGAVWLGLTVGCAQCHTHKFDPITHQEYFQLFAFFNHGMDVNNIGPTVPVTEGELLIKEPDPELTRQLEAARQELAQLDRTKSVRQATWEAELLARAEHSANATWSVCDPRALVAAGGAPLTTMEDGSILAGKGGSNETYTIQLGPLKEAAAALRLRVLTHPSLPKTGPGRASNGNFVLTSVEFSSDGQPVTVSRVEANHAQPGYPVNGLIDGDPNTGWAINGGAKMNANHEAQFTLAQPLPAGSELAVVLRHEKNPDYNVGRFAIDTSTVAPAQFLSAELIAALKTAPTQRTDAQKKLLATQFDSADSAKQSVEQQIVQLQRQIGYGPATANAMVMREIEKPRETFVHLRGDFLRKDRETGPLLPNVPAVLPPLPATEGIPTRLDLAHWLVSPDHPLTARVTVNRVWMRYFGLGLVETENDFGTQGTYPTHPELLDWLARWFMEEAGWSMKALHQLITTSATYRQSSHHRPELMEVDARNLLLARQNRIRFDAEIIRDAALVASGLLEPKIGGPSVRPPQPKGVYAFTQRSKNWVDAEGPDRFRRGLYTRFYRSAPYPMLTTFDAPDFQTVCTRRERSNTPLQALTVANSAALFEMAQGLGTLLVREAPDAEARTELAFERCYGRPASEAELERVLSFQRSQEAAFKANPESSEAIAKSPEVASWVAVARALMNTDEFITRE